MNLSSAFHHLLLSIAIGGISVVSAENNKCFESRDELKIAIDTCFDGDDYSTAATIADYDPTKCENEVKVTYGWPMNTWCTSEVDDMQLLFVGKRDFNEDISDWDTSKVTNLYETFSYASSFTVSVLFYFMRYDMLIASTYLNIMRSASLFIHHKEWNVGKVKKMYGLFNGAKKFNSDISAWDTSSLEDMQWMFYGATKFSGDISNWNVSSVTNMWEVFSSATSFNSDLSGWDTSNVLYMKWLFWGATSFNSDLSDWDVSKVANFEEMFFGATSFNGDVSTWDISNAQINLIGFLAHDKDVQYTDSMLPSLLSFLFGYGDYYLDKAAKMNGMFNGAKSFNQNLCAWKNKGFPYGLDTSTDIFANSGCTFQNRPRISNSNGGPFCASDCSSTESPVTPTESPVSPVPPTVSNSVQQSFSVALSPSKANSTPAPVEPDSSTPAPVTPAPVPVTPPPVESSPAPSPSPMKSEDTPAPTPAEPDSSTPAPVTPAPVPVTPSPAESSPAPSQSPMKSQDAPAGAEAPPSSACIHSNSRFIVAAGSAMLWTMAVFM
ncbi:LOW QUALITY PROTEIN: hypothetical protein ACHAXR_011431 [Thalassiosira sp. AJA248-18]